MPKKRKKKPQGTAQVQVTIKVPLSEWNGTNSLKETIAHFAEEAESEVSKMVEAYQMKITTPPTVVSINHSRT